MSWWDDSIDYIFGRYRHPDIDIDQKKLVETPVSTKGRAPAMDVYKYITDRYPNTGYWNLLLNRPIQRLYVSNPYSSTYYIRPSDVMNARAGDPEYTRKSFQEIKNYLDSNREYYRVGPAKHNNSLIPGTFDINDPRWRGFDPWAVLRDSGGTYKSKKDKEFIFNPSQVYNAANTPLPVRFNYAKSLTYGNSSSYNPREHSVEINDNSPPEDLYKEYKEYVVGNVPKIKYPTEDVMGLHPGYLIKYYAKGDPISYIASSVGHELNHAAQMAYPISTNFLLNTHTIDGYDYRRAGYATNPYELTQAAAAFQQQHYRNTGSRIKDPDSFEAEINKAVDNIKDYDQESRRFLDYVRFNKRNNPRIYNDIKKKMPLISKNKQLPGYNTNYKQNMLG